MTRTIVVPPGIGDSIWLLQLLINTPDKEKFHFVLPGGNPRRGKQVFDLLPQLVESSEYSPHRHIGYKFVAQENIQKRVRLWSSLPKDQYQYICLSANEWLEQGYMLNNFLPDLPLSYKLDWQTSQWTDQVTQDMVPGPRIGIYGSSYSTQRAWGFWDEHGWFDLIKRIHARRDDITYYIIGAEWDINLSSALAEILRQYNIKYINTVGKPLGYVIEMMKQLNYAFYFPSGLPILSETLHGGSDCVMFYPPHLQLMINKWSDPQRTANLNFKEAVFCTPEKIFQWVDQEYQLFNKLP